MRVTGAIRTSDFDHIAAIMRQWLELFAGVADGRHPDSARRREGRTQKKAFVENWSHWPRRGHRLPWQTADREGFTAKIGRLIVAPNRSKIRWSRGKHA
jgi:hypothetical protein